MAKFSSPPAGPLAAGLESDFCRCWLEGLHVFQNFTQDPAHGLVHALRPATRLLEAEQACSSLTRSPLSPVCVVVLLFVSWHPGVLGGATGGTWPE